MIKRSIVFWLRVSCCMLGCISSASMADTLDASRIASDFLQDAEAVISSSSGDATLSALGVSVTPSHTDVTDPNAPRGLEGELMASASDLEDQANSLAAESDAYETARDGLERPETDSAFDDLSGGETVSFAISGQPESVNEDEVVQGQNTFSSSVTDNFNDALVGMGELDDMQNNVISEGDELAFAKGEGYQCRDPINVPANQNCCSMSIPHHRISFTQCNDRERELASARRANRVVYIGAYCSHYFRFAVGRKCVEHRQTYCVFPSLLDRIVQEQGRAQLGHFSWGSLSHPNCQGFSESQMAEIDWDKLNLNEYENSISKQSDLNEEVVSESVLESVPEQVAAFDEGTSVSVNAPNAQAGDPMQVSPLEGYGPFTVTALLASNWPQVYADPDQNSDPVDHVAIDWGDGSSTRINRNALTRINGVDVYRVTHTYLEPSQNNDLESIRAVLYAQSGEHLATASVQNIYETPSNIVTEGSGGHLETSETTLNRMPDYGAYEPDSLPGQLVFSGDKKAKKQERKK